MPQCDAMPDRGPVPRGVEQCALGVEFFPNRVKETSLLVPNMTVLIGMVRALAMLRREFRSDLVHGIGSGFVALSAMLLAADPIVRGRRGPAHTKVPRS